MYPKPTRVLSIGVLVLSCTVLLSASNACSDISLTIDREDAVSMCVSNPHIIQDACVSIEFVEIAIFDERTEIELIEKYATSIHYGHRTTTYISVMCGCNSCKIYYSIQKSSNPTMTDTRSVKTMSLSVTIMCDVWSEYETRLFDVPNQQDKYVGKVDIGQSATRCSLFLTDESWVDSIYQYDIIDLNNVRSFFVRDCTVVQGWWER